MPLAFRRLCLLVLVLTVAAPAARADEERKLPPKQDFHLYLFLGQSNMAGRGTVTSEDREKHKKILMLTKENTWEEASDPVHFDKPSIVGVGPALNFGRTMKAVAEDQVVIGLIPCAVGGSELARWEKGGDLYKAALARARRAMQDGTLKGILWHQGESDSVLGPRAVTYGMRLDAMIADLRKDLGQRDLPFVCATLGEFLPLERYEYSPQVNEALRELPKRVDNTACVETTGLEAKADRVHFDAEAARELGRRFARTMRELQMKAEKQ